MANKIRNIKTLIQEGKTEKAINESLISFEGSEVHDTIVQLSNRYQNIKAKVINGEVGHSDQTILNSINASLLSVLGSVNENDDEKRKLNNSALGEVKNKSNFRYVLPIIALISGILLSYTFQSNLKKPSNFLDESRERIDLKISDRIGYKKCIYPNIAIGFLIPDSWMQEDQVARFGGSEFELVKRYEDSKSAVGIQFRLRSVQKNYINDPETEVKNQLDLMSKIDSNVVVKDITVFDRPGKEFILRQSTGKRMGIVRVV